jgi:glycosyltransferase involved in cell wall biosynthesis
MTVDATTMPTRLATLYMDYPSEHRASMDRYGRELARAINRHVVGFAARTYTPRELLAEDALARWPILHKVARYHDRYAAYPQRVARVRSDIHHVVDHSYAHLAGALPRRRTVVTCHDLMLLRMADGTVSGGSAGRITPAAFRYSIRFLRDAAAVVCDSQATALDVERYAHGDPSRLHVVYPGLNAGFRPQAASVVAEVRQRYRLPSGQILLHVGSAASYKNLEGVLRVLAVLVRARGRDCWLVKIGDALTSAQHTLAEELRIADRVVQLGSVPEADLPSLYCAASLLLFPSQWEGFGWPPLEAMACGLPVVASNRGSLAEIVGDAALVAPPHDPGALADAAEVILGDEARRADLIQRGQQQVAQFTWEHAAQAVAGIYTRVLQVSRARLGQHRRVGLI